MDFSLHDEHLALRDAVQRFCDGEYPVEQRGQPPSAEQRERRHAAMASLGLFGLTVPAEYGGSGLGAVEAMLVAQSLGAALDAGTFVSSAVMAAGLIRSLGSPLQQQQWLPALADGRLQAALAVHERGARYDWHRVQTQAHPQGDGWRLEGHKSLVTGGETADLLLVLARTPGEGLSVLAVDAHSPGLRVQAFDTLDGRRAAHLSLQGVTLGADRLLGPLGQAAGAVEAALDAGVAALCAEAAGVVEALLAHTAEHLRTRRQFGAPLSKFQVLQHRVADMAIDLEQLKSMACVAAMAVQAGEPVQRRRLVSAAKVLASQKGRAIGLAAIQLHGAMGMTDECRVGHYAKRLMVIGQSLGDAPWHLQRLQHPNGPQS